MFKPTLSLVASATLIASLHARDVTLDPIVVSANKTEQSLKEVTADVVLISAEELEEKHITSVIDALRTITGIALTQSGGAGQQSSFFQRGFSAENTVVMIDGIRYNDPTATKGQSQLEHLMVTDIERIEIINGAQSGVWGANAAAGVINIITKKPTEKLQIGGNLEYGSYATTKIGAHLSRKTGPLSYYVSAHQLHTNGISALTPRGQNPKDYEADGYTNQTAHAKLGYDITPADTLRGQFTFIDARTEYDAWGEPQSSANEIHQTNRLGSIGYRHSVNATDFIDATYALTSFERKDPLGYTKAFTGTNKELNVNGTFHYADHGFIVLGAGTLDTKDTISAKELTSKGLFFTNTNRFDNLILTESIRHDTYETFKDKTTGKLGAKYFFAEDVVLSSNYGTAYRVPSLFELYAGYYGNPNLQPETTQSFDASFRYKQLTLTHYHNLISNLIGSNAYYAYDQVEGTSRIKGYEVRYHHSLSDALMLDLYYNNLSAKNQNAQTLNRRPRQSAKASLLYYPTGLLSLGTTLNYVGTRYDDLAQTVQTGRYTLWSVVANYDLTPQLTLYLKGDNLTDKLYQEVDGYGTPGRSVYVGVNARF